jgi:hypothetical protein
VGDFIALVLPLADLGVGRLGIMEVREQLGQEAGALGEVRSILLEQVVEAFLPG